jgi:hypothetical protein
VDARRHWRDFQKCDFDRRTRRYGIDSVIVEDGQANGMVCRYRNQGLMVCRVA